MIFEKRENLIKDINLTFANVGADIKLKDDCFGNTKVVFLMLPVGRQNVYFLSLKCPVLADLYNDKYRYDILFGGQQGIKVLRRRIVVRSLETLLIIEPDGLEFERMSWLIEH